MEFETLLYEETGDGVAVVTLNRPDVANSFNAKMEHELAAAWNDIKANPAVRSVVLTAAGDRAFCTGTDRADIPVDYEFDAYTYDDPGHRLGPKSQECWKPVIGAVNGMAGGGAFYLLGECDILIAADHATFFDPHVTYGMPAVFEPITMLARMPFGEVMRMSLMGTSERISAQRAYDIGLITEIVPKEELREAALHVARTIASFPPTAVLSTLRTLWAAREMSPDQARILGNVFLNLGTDTQAKAEGQQVFTSGERPKPRIR
ncbi:MAG: enoyl-CoA hydratase/isomerase family protein [Acidimicrobiia bacterium]